MSALLAPLASLPGVGPALAERLARAIGGTAVVDLLFHLPTGWQDRRPAENLRAILPGTVGTARVEVIRHEAPNTPRQPWRVVVGDVSGFAELSFFGRPGVVPPALARLAPGTQVTVSGKAESFAGRLTFAHPDHIVADPGALPPFEPVWGLTAGLAAGHVRRAVGEALARLPEVAEWIDGPLVAREGFASFGEALRQLHAPVELPGPAAARRLAYDELFAHQLALGVSRAEERSRPGRVIVGDGGYRAAALGRFGHALTAGQARALEEIAGDLAAGRRMRRLLQGDVGSGKTLVALLAMLLAAEAGYQAALMVPTEVLARQHLATFRKLSPVGVDILAGTVKNKARVRVLEALERGQLRLVIGTHALFQQGVVFRDLALAVVDEQHRFGVEQRLTLAAKGALTHLLVMTATPIPRTRLLTEWGNTDVSRLMDKPANRPVIRTTLHALASLPEVLQAVRRALDGGSRIYWVCPLVRESEALDIAAAEARHLAFKPMFGAVGLVHGRQDAGERNAAIAAFASGRVRLLVATTVVEVGLDIPEADIMVIDHAERFGLAQLHQLRGRVGRGTRESFCLLLHDDGLTEAARARLVLLRDTNDGFEIAEADYKLRGAGDALGTAQSGEARWRLQGGAPDQGLLEIAQSDAAVLLARDPELRSARGEAARVLLGLFGHDRPGRTLESG